VLLLLLLRPLWGALKRHSEGCNVAPAKRWRPDPRAPLNVVTKNLPLLPDGRVRPTRTRLSRPGERGGGIN
jgi:hypothetical protein